MLNKDLLILSDESNPSQSEKTHVIPSTTLDQVYDQTSPNNMTLRAILEDLRKEIANGGIGDIRFPVKSVNGKTGDVKLTKGDLGLENVDNTADKDKPLSDIQRKAVDAMLQQFEFHVDLSEIYEHIQNHQNPHGVTLEMLNKDNQLSLFVSRLVQSHNLSKEATTHPDLRRGISGVWTAMEQLSQNIEKQLSGANSTWASHINNPTAHSDLFNAKQDVSMRVAQVGTQNEKSTQHYPSVRAMTQYVKAAMDAFAESIPKIPTWVSKLDVVDSISDLPSPTEETYQSAYLIRVYENGQMGLSICKHDSKLGYYWDSKSIGAYSKFDPNAFQIGKNGFTLNYKMLYQNMQTSPEMADTIQRIVKENLPDVVGDTFVTRDEWEKSVGVASITITPGTQDGTIRYYINGDASTMSEDIAVPGLKRIAYLEYISEKFIAENAIRSRHIMSRNVERRHLADYSMDATAMRCAYRCLLGNLNDSSGLTTTEISLESLAEALKPYLGI